ncbi:ABC transporter ATP-binding protein [Clostridium beijerinckii]|uniref:ABC-2 type transport system ATP-binding protein n=1 Tax=Clostridium beijerinckii TaxID=1520 RepID=A0AAX0B959_CLOBE|nr:ABC transporter ATP-binding protein [Clostridium beijerinckii]MBA8933517.1 ABC-2 type transport system ATP-binding protein [Clostridium beijerinckii]NOW05533.1 ABC-2 type transport system ATP-binding protein [Clostridium beijerinckii]NRT91935.1 ABC-2 type transport system ATP-binding protein [Clostridium beijerinckii]NRU37716.1 ABC-2 type transport system ATP-binding protein [Clostridium beijerinckii]NSA99006.1 ABC-2 type transport system ATP-binding protein [Clostridium beijerinckii]
MFDYVIETENLIKRFGEYVSVDHVNLRVPKGEIYGFLGSNGAGKTTTMRLILSLIRPDEGNIRIFNKSISEHRRYILRRVGSLIEAPAYYGHLSAYKNLKIIAELLDIPDKKINEVLETVRLTQYANKPVKGYSLGMKQRLGIAIALIREPELLILDEPTNGLDPFGIQEIRKLITDLSKNHGMTVLISSHILSEIEAVADNVGIINEGKLLFQGPMDKLKHISNNTDSLEDVFLKIVGRSESL